MTIKFYCSLKQDCVVLKVNPATLHRAFQATNPEQCRHDEWRIKRLLEMPEDTRIAILIIGACDGSIGFENGRHRALVAKLQGRKVMPVAVDKNHVAAVREILSRFRTPRSRRGRENV